ncbi:membrane protein [Sinomonas cellulolyticus]|uniref:DUF3040 domain-containing protein n=1 Tax=Sinomonas cellulolyticus TaxID=2801916 RepID=A0ABS1K1H3_9MICC|nr:MULTISPECIES: DUF3040 domain-containing protein [Sinomonas]MBL0705511.1 DUF3040 domain-containing protein [Sinomonas cellulolyticus]GHG41560.1 membrane protein [Sinomonas sp. KCTC 49339]
MPLSEHEQKMLEQLEKQLHEEDPKFADSMGADALRTFSTKHIVLGVLGVIVGILVLLTGVSIQNIFVGVLGFLVMGVSVYYGTLRRPGRRMRSRGAKSSGGFLRRLEAQWDERRREDG